MNISVGKIIRQAWSLTISNKFLWLYGLILNIFYFQSPSANGIVIQSTNTWLEILFLVIVIAFIILYFRSLAGLIIGVKAILEKQSTSLKKTFRASGLFYIRVFTVSLWLGLILIAGTWLISAPINSLATQNHTGELYTLVILGVVILVPLIFICVLTVTLAPLFIVFFDLKIREAATQALELSTNRPGTLIAFGLPLFLLGAAWIPLGFLINFLYHMGSSWSVIAAWAVDVVMVLLLAVYTVFQQSVWVLLFQELIKPEKLPEEQILSSSEAIN